MGDRPPPGSSSSEPADAKRTRQGASRFWISVYIYICVYRCDHVWYVHAQVYMHTRHDIPEHVSCTCDMRIYMKTYMLWNDLSLASI